MLLPNFQFVDRSFQVPAIASKVSEVLTYDNVVSVALTGTVYVEKAARLAWQIAKLAFWSVAYVAIAIGKFGLELGRLYGQDFYKVRVAALAIEAEDLVANPHRYAVRMVKAKYQPRMLDITVSGGGFAELRAAAIAACPGYRLDKWELV